MATELSQSQLLDKIGITHAGTYCLLCGKHFVPRFWRDHFNRSHTDVRLPIRVNNIVNILHHKVQLTVQRYHPSIYAVSPKVYKRIQCLQCGNIFRDKSQLHAHISSNHNSCSSNSTSSAVMCFKLRCGRYYPHPQQQKNPQITGGSYYPHPQQQNPQPARFSSTISLSAKNGILTNHGSPQLSPHATTTVSPMQLKTPQNTHPSDGITGAGARITPNRLYNAVNTGQSGTSDAPGYMECFTTLPSNVCFSSSDIEAVLKQIISPGDVTNHWIKIFHKYIATTHVGRFVDTLREQLLSSGLKPQVVMATHIHLSRLMDMYIELESQTKGIVNGMPANWKASLVKFNATVDKNSDLEGATTWTFRYRNNSSPQVNEFAHLLCYLNYFKCPILQRYMNLDVGDVNSLASKMGMIARFIYELTVEHVPNGDYIP